MQVESDTFISLEEAQRRILSAVAPFGADVVELKDADGRVLAQEVRAGRDEPVAPQAAMDGYGVRSADVKSASPDNAVVLQVVGSVTAGDPNTYVVKRGQAVRIMTGCSMPAGADAVVPQEIVNGSAAEIAITAPIKAGDWVVPVGGDFHSKQELITAGTVLGAKELTVLAALGYTAVKSYRQPQVAVLATGNELVEVGETLSQGKVYASNLHTVSSLVKSYSGRATSLGIAPDDLETLIGKIKRGMREDILLTTGGTGKGKKDLIAAAVEALKGKVYFRGVAIRPGKQTLFARLDRTLLFSLPGKPTAAYVAFQQLVRPALLRMLGVPRVLPPEVTATMTFAVQASKNILSFQPCRLVLGPEGFRVRSFETRGTLAEIIETNGLLKLPPGKSSLEVGEQARVQVLDTCLAGLSYFPTD
jgi:molybdopterin molybdotransferase